ncbi:MAG: MFS transporter [Promethearchaeota archaeon]
MLKENSTLSHSIPFKQKACYGISMAGLTFMAAIIDGAMLKYYTDFILFPAILFGIAQLFFGIWNSINDPLIGYYSDKKMPKDGKGKRKVWLYRSIPFMGCGYFFLIFMNPTIPHLIIFLFLLAGLAIFDTGNAIFGINRTALMISITDDDKERASLVVVSLIFQTIVGIFAYLIPIIFLIGTTPLWLLYVIFTVVGIIGTVNVFIGVMGIKEPPKLYEKHVHVNLKKILKDYFHSKTFIAYTIFSFLMNGVTSTVVTFQLYYFEDVIGSTGTEVALVSALILPISFLSYYLIQIVNKKLGVRKALLFFMGLHVMGFFGLLLTRMFIFAVIFYTIINVGNAGFWILSLPLFGNVIDEYEYNTGNRNEGTFMGIQAIFISPSKSIMIFIFTWIITLMGYRGEALVQTEQAILGIQLGAALIPLFFLIAAFIILLFFPLRGQKLIELKKAMKKIYEQRLE